MPLLSATLENSLNPFMDTASPVFQKYPETVPEFAQNFAQALFLYFSACTVPSVTIEAAKQQAIAVAISNAYTSETYLEDIVQTFLASYALGTLPGFSTTLPVTPLDLSPVYSLGLSGQNILPLLCTMVDAWVKTAIAVNNFTGIPVLYA